LDALGAVEDEFTCSGMCRVSLFYTFSDVANGPPFQNCTEAIADFAEDYFPCWGTRFFIHSVSLLMALIATGFITFGKKEYYMLFENEEKFVKGIERSDDRLHNLHHGRR
jgi:hypothetical protein